MTRRVCCHFLHSRKYFYENGSYNGEQRSATHGLRINSEFAIRLMKIRHRELPSTVLWRDLREP